MAPRGGDWGPSRPTRRRSSKQSIEIILTDRQKGQVKEQTGRDMDVLELSDGEGFLHSSMPLKTPDDITILAIRKARLLNDGDKDQEDWLHDLAKDQDDASEEARKIKALEKQIAKDTKKQQKKLEDKFAVIQDGKDLKKEKAKAKAKKQKQEEKAARKADKASAREDVAAEKAAAKERRAGGRKSSARRARKGAKKGRKRRSS